MLPRNLAAAAAPPAIMDQPTPRPEQTPAPESPPAAEGTKASAEQASSGQASSAAPSSNAATAISEKPASPSLSRGEKKLRFRVRLLCALTGAWGVATGYALFILISQREEETRGFSAFAHFLGVLTVAVFVVAITEWFRDTIRGETPQTFRSLSAILTSVMLLAVFEVCVLSYEEVSNATFQSPYAVKEIAARVSGKEISYAFFRPEDILEPKKFLDTLINGYKTYGQMSPPGWVVFSLGQESNWTLFPHDFQRPPRHDVYVTLVRDSDYFFSDRARSPAPAPGNPHPETTSAGGNPGIQPGIQPVEPDFGDDLGSSFGEAPVDYSVVGLCFPTAPLPLRIPPPILSWCPAISQTMTPADQVEYNSLVRKLNVLNPVFPTYTDSAGNAVQFDANGNPLGTGFVGIPPCDQTDLPCPPPAGTDVTTLAEMNVEAMNRRTLRQFLTVELNRMILYPIFYNDDAFHDVDAPEGVLELLDQEHHDGVRYGEVQGDLNYLRAQPETEKRDDDIAEDEDEMAHLESRLLPIPRVVQLNRELLVSAFPGMLAPAPEQSDDRSTNLIVLGLLWMFAGGALGWILAGAIFDRRERGEHPSRKGALRGLIAALGVAPAFVVAYVLLLRLGTLIHDAIYFNHELHYLWEANAYPPTDMFSSTLIPTLLRLDAYMHHPWITAGVALGLTGMLAIFWYFFGKRSGLSQAQRWGLFAISVVACALLGIVFDANIPFIYLLVGLVWVTPAVFIGMCGPYLRTGAPLPQAWGMISMVTGIALVALTLLRLKWEAIPLWLCAPGIVLIATGIVMRAGLRLEQYWPLGALALGLAVCGMSAVVQRATFLGVLSDVHELNAYGGYDVKLWPKLPAIKLPGQKKQQAPGVGTPGPPPQPTWSDTYVNWPPRGGAGSSPSGGSASSGTAAPAGSSGSAGGGDTRGGALEPPVTAGAEPGAGTPAAGGGAGRQTPGWDPYDFPTPTREEMLSETMKDRIDFLRQDALGLASTGDYTLDNWVRSYETDDEKRLRGVRDDVARQLELCIVGSLGFWLTVGLLAGWAMVRTARGEQAPLETAAAAAAVAATAPEAENPAPSGQTNVTEMSPPDGPRVDPPKPS